MEATFNCRQEDNGVRSGVPRREPLLARILQVATLGTLALLAGAAPAFVEPEPLESEAIAKLLEKAGDAADHPGSSLLKVLHQTDVTVEESGLSHVVERQVVKVLDEPGVKALSVLRFNYDPASQFLEVRWVRVFKKDGTVLKLNLGKVKDLPQPADTIRWGARMKLASVSGISPGDAVAWETYSKGFQIAYLGQNEEDEKYVPPMKGHFYDVVLFEDVVPIVHRVYSLHMPGNKPVHAKVYNGEVASEVKATDGMLHYEWSKSDVPARPDEKRQPDRTDFVTKVVLATVADWKDKSAWFHETNEPIFASDPAIEKKVKEITAGKSTDEQKVEALLEWVALAIRYSGISMGKGEGYTIHPGTMTFHDRCGVCKDIAGMLITMMRAAGYTVYPAMTMAGARVEEVAADQFNHCVVAWKKPDGEYVMLDPTWAPFSMEQWSTAEGEQHYVIGSPEGEDLMSTQAFGPDQNRFSLTGKSRIEPDGSLAGQVTIQGTGYPDTRMRREIAYQQAGEGATTFRRFLTAISPFVKVLKTEIGNHADLKKPLVVKMSYADPWYAAASKDRLAFVIPLAHFILRVERWSPYFMLGDWTKRKNPAMFWFPQRVEVKETVSLPGGLVPMDLPPPQKKDGKFTSWDFSVKVKGASLEYAATWDVKCRIAQPEAFGELDELAKVIGEHEKTEIVLVEKGKEASP